MYRNFVAILSVVCLAQILCEFGGYAQAAVRVEREAKLIKINSARFHIRHSRSQYSNFGFKLGEKDGQQKLLRQMVVKIGRKDFKDNINNAISMMDIDTNDFELKAKDVEDNASPVWDTKLQKWILQDKNKETSYMYRRPMKKGDFLFVRTKTNSNFTSLWDIYEVRGDTTANDIWVTFFANGVSSGPAPTEFFPHLHSENIDRNTDLNRIQNNILIEAPKART